MVGDSGLGKFSYKTEKLESWNMDCIDYKSFISYNYLFKAKIQFIISHPYK